MSEKEFNPPGGPQGYDRIVYYVAPAALVAAILFCCFRIALVYYMQIRPRRNSISPERPSAPINELEMASGAFPSSFREIFMRAPPPSYDDTMKYERRALSQLESGVPREGRSRHTSNRRCHTVSDSTYALPESIYGPPAYSNRRSTCITDSSTLQLPQPLDVRLPSYEEITSDSEMPAESRENGRQTDVGPVATQNVDSRRHLLY
ncbi:unnamed protein product [Bursaphelenchus xylophilus]|uniref:(pine wood nematode) hypothetical protein n=1 Tax=Bursaphelenchus xylophilus TaxID=6326 RepID=A0A811L0V1_BURXY|nr:unnamed protein product [Bursaphelenchus xylophilus]CAG9107232.1 unnamed protein product [Bursaphelenchus xylophilus]